MRTSRPTPPCRALAVLLAALAPAGAAAAAGLLVPADGGAPLAIDEHVVDVQVLDGIAVTELTQVFRNDSSVPLEAVYSFPLPPGAGIAGFSMWIGGREMTGEVLERGRARKIYEEIVHPVVKARPGVDTLAKFKDPGLVEEVSYRELRVTVFPVPAQGTQKIRLSYHEQLVVEEGEMAYVYPLETRALEDSRSRGRFELSLSVRSSVPIAEYWFPGAGPAAGDPATPGDERVEVSLAQAHRIEASVLRDSGDLDRDVVARWRLEREEAGLDVLSFRRPGEDGTLAVLATAPVEPASAEPVDYTFVLDVSGSMRRRRKLEIAGEAVSRFLEACSPRDRFNLVAFNVTPEALADGPLPNDAEARRRMMRFLHGFLGVGGTDLRPALELAHELAEPGRPRALVVLSDGGVNDLDEDHAGLLELVREHDATVFAVAVGNDANVPLLEALAAESGGFAVQVSSRDDLRRRGPLVRQRMRRQPWRDLALSVDGPVELLDPAPERLPNLYPGRQLVALARYRGHGPAVVRLAGVRGGAPAVLEARVELPREAPLHPELGRAWARSRVADLLRGLRAGRLGPDAQDEIVRLGEAHCLVTPLTSFLVLETDEMYAERGIERRSHALLEEEREAREERSRRAAAAAAAAATSTVSAPARRRADPVGLGGAVDPWLLIAGLLLAGRAAARRRG